MRMALRRVGGILGRVAATLELGHESVQSVRAGTVAGAGALSAGLATGAHGRRTR